MAARGVGVTSVAMPGVALLLAAATGCGYWEGTYWAASRRAPGDAARNRCTLSDTPLAHRGRYASVADAATMPDVEG